MNAEQKQRAIAVITKWWAADSNKAVLSTGYEMAGVLQELIDADDKFKSSVREAINAAEPEARSVIVDGTPVFFSREGDDITDTHTLTPCPHCGGSGAADDCAPEPEPFGYFKAEPFGWVDCSETDEGAIALYTAPPANNQSEQHLEMVKDAERYRWLRNPDSNPAKVIDKLVSWVPLSDDGRTGGYGNYEYRAGEELDSAIDAAIAAEKGGAA